MLTVSLVTVRFSWIVHYKIVGKAKYLIKVLCWQCAVICSIYWIRRIIPFPAMVWTSLELLTVLILAFLPRVDCKAHKQNITGQPWESVNIFIHPIVSIIKYKYHGSGAIWGILLWSLHLSKRRFHASKATMELVNNYYLLSSS